MRTTRWQAWPMPPSEVPPPRELARLVPSAALLGLERRPAPVDAVALHGFSATCIGAVRSPAHRRDPADRAMSPYAIRRRSASTCLRSLPFSASPASGRYSSNARGSLAPTPAQCVPPPLMGFVVPFSVFDPAQRPGGASLRLRRAANSGSLHLGRFDILDALLRTRSIEMRRSSPRSALGVPSSRARRRRALVASFSGSILQPDLHCYLQRLPRAA
jgi:hypothetical protein